MRISQENSFITFGIKLSKIVFAIVQHKALTTEHPKMSDTWCSSLKQLIRGLANDRTKHSPIENVASSVHSLSPITLRKLLEESLFWPYLPEFCSFFQQLHFAEECRGQRSCAQFHVSCKRLGNLCS